jgi:ribosomal protein L7/L12
MLFESSVKEFHMSGISANQEQRLRELAAKGNKIAAIKLYREITNVGLKEAKDAIEAIMSGAPVVIPEAIQSSLQNDALLEEYIKRLLVERKKIEAVKLYREANHCGLKEAKDAVDLIQAGMRRDGYSSMPTTPAISNDPFAEDATSYRARLIVSVALALLILLAGTFFILRGSF